MKHILRVGVLRGGPSAEYQVSLNSGGSVLGALRKNSDDSLSSKWQVHDILIDQKGHWHLDGVALPAEKVLQRIDVAFNALHGRYGEDGTVQSFFETHGMPFTGSGSLSSAIGMNKSLTKKVFNDHGIQTPQGREIASERILQEMETLCRELFQSLHLPVVVKPVASGSSVGISIVRKYDELPEALRKAVKEGIAVLVEEYMPGIEATCAVVEGYRGQDLYALPVVEIRPHKHKEFFDYDAKYAGQSEEIVPATFSPAIKSEIESVAKKIHQALGLRHYSRSDFIIHPRRGIYALEVNTLPGLTVESLVPKALRAVGSDIPEFVEHVIALALG